MPSIARHIDQFAAQRVLVVGDLILDHYIRGSVSRTSPEAPVPILRMEGEDWLLGGAANVARNITALGGRAELVGVIGDDEAGQRLKENSRDEPKLTAHLIVEKGRPTTLKTRYVAQNQQIMRLDRETSRTIDETSARAAEKKIAQLIEKCSGVVLSDYGKGVLTPALIRFIIDLATKKRLPVIVDPKGTDYARYRGATVVTPNRKEAAEASGIAIEDLASLTKAAKRVQQIVKGDAVVITRSEDGISVFPKSGKPSHLPARSPEVFDVTGAGDTVIATLGLALFAGASLPEAAELGNIAAGVVIARAGVAVVSADTLRLVCEANSNPTKRKLVSHAELEQICRSLHQSGRRIVFTNGFFDLLHHGHIRLLDEARRAGDCLIVAVNSDASTRRLKGAPRPLLDSRERTEILSALPYVDYLVIFDGDTPEELLRRVKPNVLVKGALPGATVRDVVGHDIVAAHGGEVRLVPLEADDTRISKLIKRAQKTSKR